MDDGLHSRVSDFELRRKQFGSRVESFATEMDDLFQKQQLRLFIGSINSLDAFLDLSRTLEDVYNNLLCCTSSGLAEATDLQAASDEDYTRITREIQNAISFLAIMDNNAEISLRDVTSLAVRLKSFYNSDILLLRRQLDEEMEAANQRLSDIGAEIAIGTETISDLNEGIDRLTASIESSCTNLKSTSKTSSKIITGSLASLGAALGFLALAPESIVGWVLLAGNYAANGISVALQIKLQTLFRQVRSLIEQLRMEETAMQEAQNKLSDLEDSKWDLSCLSIEMTCLSTRATALCHSSREVEALFTTNKTISRELFLMSKDLTTRSEMLELASTQQQVLHIIKAVSLSLIESSQFQDVFLCADQVRQTKTLRISLSLEKSISTLEAKSALVSTAMGWRFDVDLQRRIARIGGCGSIIHESLERHLAPRRRLEKLSYILVFLTVVSLGLVILIESFLPEQILVVIMVMFVWYNMKAVHLEWTEVQERYFNAQNHASIIRSH